ncbi:protein NPC2 homolog [Anoplophora glabripennis]|uniref:protein NPC2 homolog n=1 Tax=Anoplophora glabripennis TaxID=217634 RepID=UPI000874A09D|nr:protein NPC2 homolog [Anoplophora glabripennis]
MQAFIVFSLSLILCCSFVACGYSDCGSEDGAIVSLEITGCSNTAKRCILKRNTNSTLVLSFTSNVESSSLTAVVHGVILGVPMPFDLPNPDCCKDSGITCPVASGQTYKYEGTFPILGSYPRVTVDIKWEIKDKDGKDIVCALIPAKIG